MTAGGWMRVRHMAWGWGSVGLAYAWAACWPLQGLRLGETAIDRVIAFDPQGVWIYLSFFLLVPAAFLCGDARRLPGLCRSMQMCAAVAAIAFVAYPTTLSYPAVTGSGWSDTMLRFVMAHDSPRNCLPSLHAALTVLSVLCLCEARRPARSMAIAAWGLLILHAIVQTRRHLAWDVSAGLLLGMASARWAQGSRPLRALTGGAAWR
ncbi:phosphatase PAP2 family protein [Ideonella sp. DXS29W]|uniref:Phosphatase PAP2 family protein n=1 Tax=Ideonella lacteola TaxID=2984193 RepID=A0ABU9BLD6_9BURK